MPGLACLKDKANIAPLAFCGDLTGNLSDVAHLADCSFLDSPALPCFKEGDVDASDVINVADLTYMVDYLFRGGPDPVCGLVK